MFVKKKKRRNSSFSKCYYLKIIRFIFSLINPLSHIHRNPRRVKFKLNKHKKEVLQKAHIRTLIVQIWNIQTMFTTQTQLWLYKNRQSPD
jgi:hypothetical protein